MFENVIFCPQGQTIRDIVGIFHPHHVTVICVTFSIWILDVQDRSWDNFYRLSRCQKRYYICQPYSATEDKVHAHSVSTQQYMPSEKSLSNFRHCLFHKVRK